MLNLSNLLFAGILGSAEVAEHAEEGGNGIFSGTLADSIWTIVWFIVLILVLWKFAWKHILAGLQAREDKITKEISDAEKARVEAQKVLTEYKDKLAKAESEAMSNARNYVSRSEDQARAIVAGAQEESKLIKNRAQNDIERAKREAEKELVVKAGDIVLTLGKEILSRSISDEDNQKIIDDSIEKYGKAVQLD